MNQNLVVAIVAGLAAGLLAALIFMALYSRRQRTAATGILAEAKAEAERLRTDAARQAESLREGR